ncbi:hypothetical protein SCLCIDRAFT_34543 [Scleroderma citrinum Foug A]|uniref:Uncharacterized protein n=1 Tax=Scleroderma citrinum Foug A TaxID=1036808 RepID=A0A0C2YKB4_9AGAM|nr:hypothetical protein SCLCIDRAFT_34543 [Scleroderma citrinum Foug A]
MAFHLLELARDYPSVFGPSVWPISSVKVLADLHEASPPHRTTNHCFVRGTFAKRTMMKLDNKIARKWKELECHPPGDTGRAMALYSLADSLDDRFLEMDDIADLEEAIALHQPALDLRLV